MVRVRMEGEHRRLTLKRGKERARKRNDDGGGVEDDAFQRDDTVGVRGCACSCPQCACMLLSLLSLCVYRLLLAWFSVSFPCCQLVVLQYELLAFWHGLLDGWLISPLFSSPRCCLFTAYELLKTVRPSTLLCVVSWRQAKIKKQPPSPLALPSTSISTLTYLPVALAVVIKKTTSNKTQQTIHHVRG